MDNNVDVLAEFLLTPLREGRLWTLYRYCLIDGFLLTPLREGRLAAHLDDIARPVYFYSRPCGRGDLAGEAGLHRRPFGISTHAPAGGATGEDLRAAQRVQFLLTPLREGRLFRGCIVSFAFHFYSRPCGRGDHWAEHMQNADGSFLLTPLREGRPGSITASGVGIYFYSRPCGRGDSNFPQVRHEVLRQIAER